MRTTESTSSLGLSVALVASLALAGCASSSWEGVRSRDTVASYSAWLRNNPDDPHAAEAKERIEFLRVKTHMSIDSFETFARRYPDSSHTAELRRDMESLYFERARASNSAAAYRAFVDAYPDGYLIDRARGNLVYVSQVRNRATPEGLREFVARHESSDFAADARATLDLLEFRRNTQIDTLAIRVEVAPNVKQPERVRRGFAAMVARVYRDMGVDVQALQRAETPGPHFDAWATLNYEESPVAGVFGGQTLLARCRFRIFHKSDPENPIWDRSFEAPAEHILAGSYGRDKTVFGNARYPFWKSFFVPVATWASGSAEVAEVRYLEEVAAMDIEGDRAVVLFKRGGFDVIDISAPAAPATIDRFRREHDLSRWEGVRLLPNGMVAIYGPDGVEIVDRSGKKSRVVGKWELPEIGSVHAAANYDSTLLVAGSRGVFALRFESKPIKPHRLLEGEFVGVQVAKPFIYLARPDRVEVTAPKHLLKHLTGSRVGLGKGFGAFRARLSGRSLYLFGQKEVVELSLDNPARPNIATRIDLEGKGGVADAQRAGSYLYMLGERGLQVAESKAEWIDDSLQVGGRKQIERHGRYAFVVGQRTLEVLDLAPYQMMLSQRTEGIDEAAGQEAPAAAAP